ncbi:hypothetical protein BDV10DRAFT_36436 [Aspergillus recurvatus]
MNIISGISTTTYLNTSYDLHRYQRRSYFHGLVFLPSLLSLHFVFLLATAAGVGFEFCSGFGIGVGPGPGLGLELVYVWFLLVLGVVLVFRRGVASHRAAFSVYSVFSNTPSVEHCSRHALLFLMFIDILPVVRALATGQTLPTHTPNHATSLSVPARRGRVHVLFASCT